MKKLEIKNKFKWVSDIIRVIIKAIKEEKISLAGKVNLYIDLMILLFFGLILISTYFDSLYVFIQNILLIIKDKKTIEINASVLYQCFLCFIIFSALCVIFMYFTSKEKEKLNTH